MRNLVYNQRGHNLPEMTALQAKIGEVEQKIAGINDDINAAEAQRKDELAKNVDWFGGKITTWGPSGFPWIWDELIKGSNFGRPNGNTISNLNYMLSVVDAVKGNRPYNSSAVNAAVLAIYKKHVANTTTTQGQFPGGVYGQKADDPVALTNDLLFKNSIRPILAKPVDDKYDQQVAPLQSQLASLNSELNDLKAQLAQAQQQLEPAPEPTPEPMAQPENPLVAKINAKAKAKIAKLTAKYNAKLNALNQLLSTASDPAKIEKKITKLTAKYQAGLAKIETWRKAQLAKIGVANRLPPEIEAVINRYRAFQRQEKAKLIAAMTGNQAALAGSLQKYALDELQDLALLAGALPVVSAKGDDDDILPILEINWKGR